MSAPSETPDTCRISTEIRVMYFDTDAGGVVHNIAYLRFIETARTLLAIQMGMSFEEIARTGIHPVVTRTEVDYKRPAKLGETLRIVYRHSGPWQAAFLACWMAKKKLNAFVRRRSSA
jgi:acyl-CoA thioesterase FadM